MSIKIGSRTFNNIGDLEQLVVHAATEYELNGYVEDFEGVEIKDTEYDELYKQLKKLNPKSVAFKGTSPSLAPAKGSVVVHDPPMTSIAKADGDDKEEIYHRWIADCAKRLGKKSSEVQIAESFKHDGVAVRVNYVKGKLHSAGLRPRDGIHGSDVTRHMKYVKGVPTKLPLSLTLSLNGEIECWDRDFEAVNAAQDEAGEESYKNPRNYTAGCMNRDDEEENKNAGLRIAFYSITGFDSWNKYYATEVERAQWAKENLELGDFYIDFKNHSFKNLAIMEQQSKKLPFYTDGVVLKVNDLEDQLDLGHTGDDSINSPRGAIAWKFVEETADATVSSIEWNASRTGRVVPTAIFDTPFLLADTENTRATCNNYGWMESQGLGPGAKVRCKKGGKIIPNIMQVLKPVKNLGAPKKCPTCSCALDLITSSSGNKDLICPNEDCAAKQVKGWMFYIAKLGGKGLGLSAMEKILHTGKVKNLPDLYTLTFDDLTGVGFGERQAVLALATIFNITPEKDSDELVHKIESARKSKFNIEAWKFFAALGIPGAGETVGKTLVSHYKDFDSIMFASEDDLLAISGIGPATAQSIVQYFDKNNLVVNKLLKMFILELPKSGKMTGKNFCLTGSFSLGKKYWQEKIENLGGSVQSSVGRTTTYLVQEHGKSDGSPSEKELKAKKMGVPIISVADLEEILE
jgi:DNA ligase (NAD+)